jgi:ribonuclease-3 family protein
MEKSINSFTESLNRVFGLSEKDWKMYSPLTLAYVGDAAYELIVRTICVKHSNCQPQKLHRMVTSCVSARAQAGMIDVLQDELTEEEAGVYRRGRNSKPYTKAKNASMEEYLKATGFEAVMGYLYLQERFDRMNELTKTGLEATGLLNKC